MPFWRFNQKLDPRVKPEDDSFGDRLEEDVSQPASSRSICVKTSRACLKAELAAGTPQ
jgi:hypothetical protein